MARLDEIFQRFWDTTTFYMVEDPLTDAALAEAEAKLGVALPAEFVSLLRLRNGGVVASEFQRFTLDADEYFLLADVHGVGSQMLDNAYYTTEWEMPPELVLLTGDGHWWIALDYRAGREPAVTYYDNELDRDIRLADDFRSFLERLEPEPEPDYYDLMPGPYHVQEPLCGVISGLERHLAELQAGEKSLKATRAWMRTRVSQVTKELPRRDTRGLRRAARPLRRAAPEQLPAVVAALKTELEALLPRWLALGDTAGRAYDEQYLSARGGT